MALQRPMAMMDILAGTEVTGSVHADGGGWVAWDQQKNWLGRTEAHRFASGELAIAAIEAAFERRSGRKAASTGWQVAK